ncbi:MAG: Imm51 family immunity protein [Polyangiaceae bacterium]
MPNQTIFEHSEPVLSPGGTFTVTVSSQTSTANGGLSQAVVTGPNGGSGLAAFYSPRVSMGFEWRSDHELVIRYPCELPPPRIDATNSSFGSGGTGRVIYEAIPQAHIQPLRWTRDGDLHLVTEESLERGVLLTFEIEGRREHSYTYYDVNESDSSSEALQSQGFQGGGYSWAGIVHGLVALHAPEHMKTSELDPEGDGVAVRSTNHGALITVAQLVARVKKDRTLMAAAIDRARLDGQME